MDVCGEVSLFAITVMSNVLISKSECTVSSIKVSLLYRRDGTARRNQGRGIDRGGGEVPLSEARAVGALRGREERAHGRMACLSRCLESLAQRRACKGADKRSGVDEAAKAFDLSLDLVRRIRIDGSQPSHTYVSPSFKHVLGHEQSDLLGPVSQLAQLFPSDVLSRVDQLPMLVKGGKMQSGFMVAYPFLHADGHSILFEHRVCFDNPPNAPPSEVIVISRDISARQQCARLEEAIVAAAAAAKEREAKLRADAYRMINHSTKRVLSNTRHMCELVAQRLEASGFREDPAVVERGVSVRTLLDTTNAECTAAINLCRSALVHARVLQGSYIPTPEYTTLHGILAELGWFGHPRFQVEADASQLVCTDVSAMRTVLLNAGMNALQHGHVGKGSLVHVTAELSEDAADGSGDTGSAGGKDVAQCRFTIRNRGGANHGGLLEAAGEGVDIMALSEAYPATLLEMGTHDSTFQGLSDIRTLCSRTLAPTASATLRCEGDHVVFELVCKLPLAPDETADLGAASNGLTSGRATSTTPSSSPILDLSPASVLDPQRGASLPAGLIFCCVDDDTIPRMVYEAILQRARADPTRSLILGETYAEVSALVPTVTSLVADVGAERVVLCLDQHLNYDEGCITGTDICTELRERHSYDGVIVILSANDEPEAAAEYRSAGADASLCKACSVDGRSLPNQLFDAVASARAKRYCNSSWSKAERSTLDAPHAN